MSGAIDIYTPIVGTAPVHPEQIEQAIWQVNPNAPPIGRTYMLLGRAQNVRADIAVAQAIQETGWFKDRVSVSAHNPAGMMSGGRLLSFGTWDEGIQQHIEHLKSYVTPGTWYYSEQIRRTGRAGRLIDMATVWAPSPYQPPGMPGGTDYARKIAQLANHVLSVEPPAVPGIKGHWAEPELAYALDQGWIRGYEDGYVYPDWPVSRAELSTILYRLFPKAVSQAPVYLADVSSNHWAYAYIVHAVLTDRVRPDGGVFRPDDPATRAEVAHAIVALGVPPITQRDYPGFADVQESTPYFTDIVFAYRNGWLNGYGDGTFKPYLPVTRAESIVAMHRIKAVMGEAPAVLPQHGASEEQVAVATSASWSLGIWLEKAKTWISSRFGVSGDELFPVSIQWVPKWLIQTITSPYVIGAGIGALGVYLLSRKPGAQRV